MKRALALGVVLLVSGCGGESATQTVTRAAASALPTQRPAGAKVGHWAGAYRSPDGKALLAQWSAECEVPIAFFVRGRDGAPKPVVGKSLRDAPMSVADGWTQDGRAIVEFSDGRLRQRHPQAGDLLRVARRVEDARAAAAAERRTVAWPSRSA